MLRMKIALAAGLAIVALAVGVVLASSPPAVLATNSVPEHGALRNTASRSIRICQGGERLPAGTRSIEASVEAYTGPRLQLKVYSGARVLTSGVLDAGWSGRAVPISVEPVRQTAAHVEVCLSSTFLSESIAIVGSVTGRASEAHGSEREPLGGRMRIVYLGRGHTSWLEQVGSVATHMELGRAWSGPWVAPVLVLLMLVAAATSSALALRERDE